MAIHLPAAPPEAIDALRNHLFSLLAQAAPVGLSRVVPVYSAGAQDVIDERLLDAARLTAWRTIVSKEGASIAAAEVGIDMSLSQIDEGRLVAGMVEAVRQAEERFADDNRDYELRLLRIPAVYTVALWLHAGDADVLMPVAPAARALRANDSYGADAFTAALRPLAESALREPDIT
ncbi:MAG: hypothetical protein AABO58_17030 [Acidobacteriota bacterium]